MFLTLFVILPMGTFAMGRGTSFKPGDLDAKIVIFHGSKMLFGLTLAALLVMLAFISILTQIIRQKSRTELKLRESEEKYRELVQNSKRVEENLRRSEARYATIFHTAAVAIWEEDFSEVKSALDELKARQVTDLSRYFAEHPEFLIDAAQNLQIVNINEAAIELYEAKSKEEMLGSLSRLFIPESYHNFQKILLAIAEGRSFFEAESVNKTLKGRVIDILIRITIPAEVAEFGNLLVTIVDITERKLVEKEVRRFNAELEQRVKERTLALETSNNELQSFCYSVSHDLRAPLRHINSFSKILLEDYAARLDQQGQNFLQRLCASSNRMGFLIDDLLELSRVSRSDINQSNVNLSELARQIAQELRETEPLRNVRFLIADDIAAWGDPELLRLVLQNLLGNAWKYTSKMELASIRFGITEIEGTQTYFIEDNGIGFDMLYADKLFVPFQRLHGMNEFEGTGIGLASAQRIIIRHGGKIWAQATVGNGACFYFTLGMELPAS